MSSISVILLTYNREQYLPDMLDSLRNQTFDDYELILVNNGSTDGTAEICAAYAEADARVKLVTIRQNIGASFGRNSGLAVAVGEYVLFVDDDDRCEPSMLSFLANLAREENADIAMCGSYNDLGDRLEPYFICNERFVFDRLQGLRELLNRRLYNAAPPTKLFRRSLWTGLSFPDNVLVDDIHVIYKVFERAQRIAVWNIAMYVFRKHTSNMTALVHNKQMTPELLDEYLAMYHTRAEYLSTRAPEIAQDIENSLLAFMQSMCENIISNCLPGCEKQLTYMTKYLANKGEDYKAVIRKDTENDPK
ncbi:glycosyltransferase family A protein [Paenibacillus sp. chi10]|uniref:Glycosyltransferase family A protein n=1 Tax=Paenibacillus suaedae TaxID=3077233 RepID=A0AAJ2K0W4_9BACL|nr:glycosyltransferase family A protein [Paenibacillus sp. chi10]MDT8979922.1 glycosyltransferase family A protein [Paenibacillus sp. chi10]